MPKGPGKFPPDILCKCPQTTTLEESGSLRHQTILRSIFAPHQAARAERAWGPAMLNREKSLINRPHGHSAVTQSLRTVSTARDECNGHPSAPGKEHKAQSEQPSLLSPGGWESRAINGLAADRLGSKQYAWAWRHYQHACTQHWLPEQIDLQADQRQWQDKHALSTDERAIAERSLSFINAAKTLLAEQHVLRVYPYITNAECRHYLLRQAFEETLHLHASRLTLDALQTNRDDSRAQHKSDAMARKPQWLSVMLLPLDVLHFDTGMAQQAQQLLRALVASYVVYQGLFLHIASIPVFSLERRQKMEGIAQMLHMMQRDENRQVLFGIDLINQIKIENPHLWTEVFREEIQQLVREAVTLETHSLYEGLPRGILGLNAPMLEEYLQFMANRRCSQIGLENPFVGATNPFPWLDAQTNEQPTIASASTTSGGGDLELDWNH